VVARLPYLLSAKKLEQNSESLWQNDVGQNNFKNYLALHNFAESFFVLSRLRDFGFQPTAVGLPENSA
jgi:hypothetical protein